MGIAAKRTAIGTAVVFAAMAASTIARAQYDDPAIAICEYILKAKELLPSEVYARVRASVRGNSAEIDYTTSILNTAPQKHTKVCTFELKKDGFHLKIEGGNADKCHQVDLRKHKSCLEGELAKETERLKVELPLILTGIYPIKPESTELKASGKAAIASTSAHADQLSPAQRASVERLVRAHLANPYLLKPPDVSMASFGSVSARQIGPQLRVCGWVNAPTKGGGYTGRVRFLVMADPDVGNAITVLGNESAGMAGVIRKGCREWGLSHD